MIADSILLLGHAKKAGLDLARSLAWLGYRPMAADWSDFSPRAYWLDRPDCILADVDQPHAKTMTEFAPWVRKLWGEAFPIIALTKSRKFKDISGLLDGGASDCLPQPPPVGLLERKITRCLANSAAPGPDAELMEEVPRNLSALFSSRSGLVRLGDLADMHAGATPRRAWCRRLAPPDDSWRGVITSEAVDRFFVGKPSGYLLWSRFHLFRVPSPEEYSVPEKVLLRRSGPPLAAAVDRSRLPAGTDVYSLVPREGTSAGYLACLLNSRLLDFYFNRFAGAADGRLRLDALRETPVPVPAPASARELSRLATLLAHFGPNPEGWTDRQSKDELWEQMEDVVFGLYGADRETKDELAALHF